FGPVQPDRVVRNSTGRAGDQLLLTKPIGTGIISTAIKHGVAPAVAEAAAIASMLQLNQAAAAAMTAVGVSAATDVTGFGLLGHLRTMARASGVSATVQAAAVPVLPGAEALADAGEVPGGTRSNERSLRTSVQWSDAVLPPRRILLCDAQTSGGLLMAVPPSAQPRLEAELAARGVAAYRVGDLPTMFDDVRALRDTAWTALTPGFRAGALDAVTAGAWLNAAFDDLLAAVILVVYAQETLSLREAAATDSLTGLTNHRAFFGRLEEELRRAARIGYPVSLLLLDLDNFKQYNDEHGHPAGDQVLRQVAEVLMTQRRVTDTCARYGGEEFAMIFPGTPAADVE